MENGVTWLPPGNEANGEWRYLAAHPEAGALPSACGEERS